MHKNKQQMAMMVKAIVDEHYQPGSAKGCLLDCWRNHVVKVYPMCQSTFYKYVEWAIRRDGYVGNGQNRVNRIQDFCGEPRDMQMSLF